LNNPIANTLQKLRRRVVAMRFVCHALRSALFFYSVLVVLTAVAWGMGHFRPALNGLAYALAWPWILGVVSSSIITLFRIPSMREMAVLMDSLTASRDRFLTALEFSNEGEGMRLLARRESEQFVNTRDFWPHLPWRFPRELALMAVPLLTLAIFWIDGLRDESLRRAHVASEQQQSKPVVEQLEKVALTASAEGNDEVKKIAEQFRKSAAEIRKEAAAGQDAQKAALREIAELEALIQEMQRPAMPDDNEWKALANSLAQNEATAEIAREIQQSKLTEAARKLEELASQSKNEQADRALQQALNDLAQSKEQLSKAMQNLAQAATQNKGRGNLLKQMAQTLRQMQNGKGPGQQGQNPQNKPNQEMLKKMQMALQQIKEQQQGNANAEMQAATKEESDREQVSMLSFDNEKHSGAEIPFAGNTSQSDATTSPDLYANQSETPDETKRAAQIKGNLAEGESLSALIPSVANSDAKATRRFKELTDAAAAAAQDTVTQESIPLGARQMIRRYFEAIRSK
jgi:hypothetical protein